MLGVTIDDKMKFEKHIANVRKVSQQIAVLKRMRKILPFETRKCLYLAFIIPHFNYCPETWHFCNKNTTAKLEKVYERALSFVFNKKQTPCCELLDKIGPLSLVNQRLAKIVCAVFKVTQQRVLKNCNDYERRRNYILKLPKVNTTTYGLKPWRFLAAKRWSLIPASCRTIRFFKVFKNAIRKLDLSGLIWSLYFIPCIIN